MRLLCDEEAHVRFQAERLAILRRERTETEMKLTHLLHRLLYSGACLVVWHDHGKAIRRGGMSIGVYWRRSWKEFRAASKIVDPKSYAYLPRDG